VVKAERNNNARLATLAAPSVALHGVYFIDTSLATSDSRTDSADYVEFTSSGYIRRGIPALNGNRCDLTSPNGMPFCEQYQFDGQTLSVLKPWGETVQIETTASNNGTLQKFDGNAAELLAPVNQADILGRWESQNVYISNFAGCLVGTCQTSIIDRSYTFDANGQFRSTYQGEASGSINIGIVFTTLDNSDAFESSGTYRIVNNTIELNYSNGQTEKQVLHLTQYDSLVIGDTQ